MTEREILDALGQGEAFDWEFKSAQGGVPGSLWETYSAMANTLGGMIVLGVEENDGEFRIPGLPDPSRAQKTVWDTLNDRGKISANLCRNDDIFRVQIGAVEVLAIRVRQALRRERPVYVGQNPLRGTYQRRHEGDYQCSRVEVGRMLADQSELPPDSQILGGFDLEDLDPSSIQQYRNRFSARFPDHPWLSLETKDLLLKLGGWRKDRESNQDGLTVAGILMFGKDESIRDAQAVPQFHIDYQEKLTESPGVRWSDRIYPDGTWTANVFQFYQRVYGRLVADLPIPFQLGSDMYRRDETLVHEAVRESLVNALVHADYGGIGGIRIVREKHRIELRNPGTLLVTVEQLARGGVSECRNKSLQMMFQMMGAGEKAGSGVDKILAGWNSQQWLLPEVVPGFGPDQVTWRLPFVSLLPTESIRRLSEAYGEDLDSLSIHERLALVIADVEGCVTNVRMQLVSEQHPADLSKMLRGLVSRGILVSTGRTRATSYSLSKGYGDSSISGEDSSISGEDSSISGEDSAISGRDSSTSGRDSSISGRDSSTSSGRASDLGTDGIASLEPMDVDALRLVAEQAGLRGKHSPAPAVENAIVQICKGRFLTLTQIATILQREPNGLRNNYLTPLVRTGKLQLLYPGTPTRPGQAYTAAIKGE